MWEGTKLAVQAPPQRQVHLDLLGLQDRNRREQAHLGPLVPQVLLVLQGHLVLLDHLDLLGLLGLLDHLGLQGQLVLQALQALPALRGILRRLLELLELLQLLELLELLANTLLAGRQELPQRMPRQVLRVLPMAPPLELLQVQHSG